MFTLVEKRSFQYIFRSECRRIHVSSLTGDYEMLKMCRLLRERNLDGHVSGHVEETFYESF